MIKVVIIDDDETLLQILSAALEESEFQLVTATNGKNGINLVKDEQPNVVLLDQILPDISGIDVLNAVKKDLKTNSIPIIMFTSYSNSEVQKRAEELGISAYLLKFQIPPENLGAYLKNVVNKDVVSAPQEIL